MQDDPCLSLRRHLLASGWRTHTPLVSAHPAHPARSVQVAKWLAAFGGLELRLKPGDRLVLGGDLPSFLAASVHAAGQAVGLPLEHVGYVEHQDIEPILACPAGAVFLLDDAAVHETGLTLHRFVDELAAASIRGEVPSWLFLRVRTWPLPDDDTPHRLGDEPSR
jgi:hypothetical protein